jgi:hypothetical protein
MGFSHGILGGRRERGCLGYLGAAIHGRPMRPKP